MTKEIKKKKSFFARSLDTIEIVGNKLPHPATIFAMLAMIVIVLSWIGYFTDVQSTHPVTGATIKARNLISADGLRWMYSNLLPNFLLFPPLGYVLVVMVGIGVAEGSGLFTLMIRALVLKSPERLITAAIVTAGIISHLASEAGYVVLIPLGALIFHALGRHPMAGLAAAFIGVSGGFGSNFFIGSIDPILAGISETAAQIIRPDITVNPAVNY
jgi:aminobenzoyl-glutamate transport protein